MLNDSSENIISETGITPNVDFLPGGNSTHKDNVEAVGNPLSGIEATGCYSEQTDDYSSCSSTELRGKFPRTYKCWDNMKQRRKKGAIIHKDFEKFSDFLTHVGPCEKSGYTLDRIDNSDPGYAPGKVAWRDKYAQNSNKGNNVYLTHEDGRRFTVAQWAAITKQSPATLYKRKKAGWNDMAVITGKNESQSLSLHDNPWPYQHQQGWEDEYRKAVLSGYGESRLVFLRDNGRKILSSVEFRLRLLAFAIQDNIGYDDDRDEYLTHQYLARHGCSLDEFKDMSVEDMRQMVDDLEGQKYRCEKALKQANEQIEYENKKDELLSRKDDKIDTSKFLKYFAEAYPRPVYTINQPPSSQDMVV